jgi:putative OPT family oligopeptide transporter
MRFVYIYYFVLYFFTAENSRGRKMSTIKSPVQVEPFVPASTTLPEVTFRAIVLGIILAIVLAASSTFVGLKIARTISGSIPAALISMLVLRRFRNANILENNMVQTIASAGETVAAGVIFTFPALVIMGYWKSFDYFQTAMITMIGGILGVLFSVPLRRSMVVKEGLPYPEGMATGEVLKAGESTAKGSTKILFTASIFSAVLAFLQTGFKVAGEQLQYWTKVGSTAFGGSLVLSPVLMAAGYIVGMRGLISFMVGGLLTWGIAIPIYVAAHNIPLTGDVGSALALVHKLQFRYVGVGVLAVGGLWSVFSLLSQISQALKTSFTAMKTHQSEHVNTLRTDRDLPFKFVLFGIAGISVPLLILFYGFTSKAGLGLSPGVFWSIIVFATVFALIVGFIAASIAAYVVGIVGTTSLPVSGITIASIMAFAGCLLVILKPYIDFSINTEAALQAAALVIVFAAVVCIAAALSGDNMQDLKAGQLVGATPWKQQIMLVVGAVVSALVIPFILQTTFEAYGIGDVLPRLGMNPEHALPAPQATLMATVAKGFFIGQLPWYMIGTGAALAVMAIIVDEILKAKQSNIRFPVLLFALGVYLPFGYITAFFVGGLVRSFAEIGRKNMDVKETDHGILCASGIIAGEAILGAVLTIPFAYYQTTDVFALNLSWLSPYQTLIGVLLYVGLCAFLYKQARR